MQIGELAKKTGLNVETLRYYEKQGLLIPVSRTEAGYREYNHQSVKQVKFIQLAKSLGFTLAEVSELLTLKVEQDQRVCAEVKTIAEEKLREIEQKIKSLSLMRASLKEITDACCGGQEPATSCSILSALDKEDSEETIND